MALPSIQSLTGVPVSYSIATVPVVFLTTIPMALPLFRWSCFATTPVVFRPDQGLLPWSRPIPGLSARPIPGLSTPCFGLRHCALLTSIPPNGSSVSDNGPDRRIVHKFSFDAPITPLEYRYSHFSCCRLTAFRVFVNAICTSSLIHTSGYALVEFVTHTCRWLLFDRQTTMAVEYHWHHTRPSWSLAHA
jgi:hypothetical protein